MKKAVIQCLLCIFLPVLAGCAGRTEEKAEKSEYAQAVDVLKAVADTYTEEEKFAMYGGDQEHAVMDEPGSFDINRPDEMEQVLGLPAGLASEIEDAASMVHMMNGNVFTGAAYRLHENTDRNAFAESVKTALLDRQWMCGQPDTLTVMDADGYVITAYGSAELMKTFQAKVMTVCKDAKILAEAPVG